MDSRRRRPAPKSLLTLGFTLVSCNDEKINQVLEKVKSSFKLWPGNMKAMAVPALQKYDFHFASNSMQNLTIHWTQRYQHWRIAAMAYYLP